MELFISAISLKQTDLSNRLFCTFSSKEGLDTILDLIKTEYVIMHNKIFVLESVDSEEYLCTYNIEVNSNSTTILPNTILVHRKKEFNVLYTINSLNVLIKTLNGDVLDTKFPINWNDYRNSILLTTGSKLRKLDTTVHRIVAV